MPSPSFKEVHSCLNVSWESSSISIIIIWKKKSGEMQTWTRLYLKKKTKKNTNNGIQECSYWESRRKSGEEEGAGAQILFEYYFLKNNSWWKTKTGGEIPRSSSQFPFLVCFELISANPVLILFKLHCHRSKLWSSADCIANNSILKKLWFQ